MALSLEQLIAAESIVEAQALDDILKKAFPSWIHRYAIKSATRRIEKHVIQPILEAESKDMERLFSRKIPNFSAQLTLIYGTIQRADYSLSETSQFSQFNANERIEKICNSKWIPQEVRDKILALVEGLYDYNSMYIFLLENRAAALNEVLKKLDYRDLISAVYGASLASVCIMRIIRSESKDIDRLSALVAIGSKYVPILSKYSDSLDILTNSEEKEMMKRAEEWENRQLQDN